MYLKLFKLSTSGVNIFFPKNSLKTLSDNEMDAIAVIFNLSHLFQVTVFSLKSPPLAGFQALKSSKYYASLRF